MLYFQGQKKLKKIMVKRFKINLTCIFLHIYGTYFLEGSFGPEMFYTHSI